MKTHPIKQSRIFGILNVTNDSFSDGGQYLNTQDALVHGDLLVKNGADVIDIGAVSSNPDATLISTQKELNRLEPLVKEFRTKGYSISIDTYNPEVQKEACQWDIDFINDIHGFRNSEVHEHLANSKCKLVLMYSVQDQGPATKKDHYDQNITSTIKFFFEKQIQTLQQAGVHSKRIILDPGMGFFLSANPQMSLEVLRQLQSFKSDFDNELLISVSRKSFLGNLTGLPTHNRDFISLATELWASMNGADWIRTHNPLKLKPSLQMWDLLESS